MKKTALLFGTAKVIIADYVQAFIDCLIIFRKFFAHRYTVNMESFFACVYLRNRELQISIVGRA